MNYIGILYTALIFAGCFFFVHLIALAVTGFKSLRQKPEPPEEPPKQKEEPQKIYYIVERKRSRKSTYSEPKEINFKK